MNAGAPLFRQLGHFAQHSIPVPRNRGLSPINAQINPLRNVHIAGNTCHVELRLHARITRAAFPSWDTRSVFTSATIASAPSK